jgi:hypothetical protein
MTTVSEEGEVTERDDFFDRWFKKAEKKKQPWRALREWGILPVLLVMMAGLIVWRLPEIIGHLRRHERPLI